jgi:hypothetical protein
MKTGDDEEISAKFLSYLCAKSVACKRLNVLGVSLFFFLPLGVISLTNSAEFH